MQARHDIESKKLSSSEQVRLFAAIGHVVVSFQQVELWLAEALSSALELRGMKDPHIVSSAMSFRQKVDLLAELYPRKQRHTNVANIKLVKKALYSAEVFRNHIVHSLWAVEGGEWVRIKGTIKGKIGFALSTNSVNVAQIEAAAKALLIIREWELQEAKNLKAAIDVLDTHNVIPKSPYPS